MLNNEGIIHSQTTSNNSFMQKIAAELYKEISNFMNDVKIISKNKIRLIVI
jgi:hypothetical protein